MSSRFLGAALAVAVAAPVHAAGAQIELRPEALVGPGPVTLGQVAYVRSSDLALIRQLVDLPVGRAPTIGQPVVMEREVLSVWLQRRLRGPATLAWAGPAQSRVGVASRRIPGEEIAAIATQALRRWLADRSERADTALAWLPQDLEVPDGPLRLQPRPLAAPVRSRMVVWVDVWAADSFVRAVPVSFAVQAWRDVAVAVVPLEQGATIAPAQVERRRVEVAALDGAPLAQFGGGAMLRVRHDIAAGAPLRARDVALPPVVQRGEWASLRSGTGAVLSEARVEVLQDGRPGDKVLVRQTGAMAQVTARVLGPGQLEVVR